MKKAKSRLTSGGLIHPKSSDIRVARDSGQPCHGDLLLGPDRAVTRSGPCVSKPKHNEQMKNSMESIIPLETSEGQPTVNARDLHDFLNIGKHFATWIVEQIDQWGFVEGQDFITEKFDSPKLGNQKQRGGDRRSIEYHLSLDMAKELSMVSRNARGREARRYFIECEKRLQRGEAAYGSLSVESLIKELYRRMWNPGIMSGLLKQILPLGQYGEIARNGLPKTGLRRSAWTAQRGRMLEAAKLATQLQLFELMGEDGMSLA